MKYLQLSVQDLDQHRNLLAWRQQHKPNTELLSWCFQSYPHQTHQYTESIDPHGLQIETIDMNK